MSGAQGLTNYKQIVCQLFTEKMEETYLVIGKYKAIFRPWHSCKLNMARSNTTKW